MDTIVDKNCRISIQILAHTDPPAARVVKSSSKHNPSFPAFVRVSLVKDGPPEITSNSSNLLMHRSIIP